MHTAKLKYLTEQFFIYRVSLVRLLVCWLVLMQANGTQIWVCAPIEHAQQ